MGTPMSLNNGPKGPQKQGPQCLFKITSRDPKLGTPLSIGNDPKDPKNGDQTPLYDDPKRP